MVGWGPGSRRRVRQREPTLSSETTPSRDLLHPALVPRTRKGGLLGRVLLRPPRSPRQAIRIPCKHRHRKSSTVPSRGTERKNIPAGQTAGTLPRQHPTPLGAPHTTHYALVCISRPSRAPEGQNPKRPQPHQGNPVWPPFYIATRPATTQAASRHLNRRHLQMAERNLTPGGPPVDAAEKQNQPSPGGVHHLLRLNFLERAAVSIRLARLRRSGRSRTTHRR